MWDSRGWDRSKERFAAFWEGRAEDRLCFAVTAPCASPPRDGFESTGDLHTKWRDLAYRHAELLHQVNSTYYGGDGFPLWQNFVAAGALAPMLGTTAVFDFDTVWVDRNPPIRQWQDRRPLRLDEDSDMWRLVHQTTEYFCAHADGRYLSGVSDIGGNLDTAAAIRGSEQLLMDFYDHPREVARLVQEIDHVWFQCYDRLTAILAAQGDYIGSWMPLWCPGTWYPLQCDAAAMISPAQFEQFVLPGLLRQAERLDRTIFHLDGLQSIAHLDILLSTERILGIDWVPDAPRLVDRGSTRWYPLFRRIRDAGKLLVVRSMWPRSLPGMLETFGADGLFLSAICETEQEARDLENLVSRTGVPRRAWRGHLPASRGGGQP